MYAGERVEFLALQGLHLVPYGTELLPTCARATSAVSVVVTNYRLLLQFLGLTRDKKTRPPITLPLMSISNVQRGATSSEAQTIRNDTIASRGLFGYSTQANSNASPERHASTVDFNTTFSHNPTLAGGGIDPKALTGDPLLWVDVLSKQGPTYRLAIRSSETQIQFVASLFDSELAAQAKSQTSSSGSKHSSSNSALLAPLREMVSTLTTDLQSSSSSESGDDEDDYVESEGLAVSATHRDSKGRRASPLSPASGATNKKDSCYHALSAAAAHTSSMVDPQPTATVSDVVDASVFMSELVKAMDRAMPRKLTDYFAFVHYAALRSGAVSALMEQERTAKEEEEDDVASGNPLETSTKAATTAVGSPQDCGAGCNLTPASAQSYQRLRSLERQLINTLATNPSEWQPPGMKGSVRLSIVGSFGLLSAADALLIGLGKTLPNRSQATNSDKQHQQQNSPLGGTNASILPSARHFAKDLAKCHDTAWGAFNLLKSLFRMTVANTPTAADSVGLSSNLLPWFHVFELVGGRSLGAAIDAASSLPADESSAAADSRIATEGEMRLYGDVVHDAELTRRSCCALPSIINNHLLLQEGVINTTASSSSPTAALPILCPQNSHVSKLVKGGSVAPVVSHPQMAVANANELRATFSTYPAAVVLPKRASNIDTITACAKYRQNGRIPSVSWIHIDTGACLARSSQPRVGGGRNSREDQLVLSYMNQTLHAGDAEAQHERDKQRKAAAATNATSVAASPVKSRQAPPPSLMGGPSAPPPQLFSSSDISASATNNGPFSMSSVSITNSNPTAEDRMLHVLDCRSVAAATTNMAAGGGYELVQNYQRAKIHFLNLDNIHGVRKAFDRLTKLVQQNQTGDTIAMPRALRQRIAASTGNTMVLESSSSNNDGTSAGGAFWARLEATEWPLLVQRLLWSATRCAGYLQKGDSVLVHCTDGWDRTSQIVTLSMIMLDSHFRTIEGFCELLQREWLEYGHRFADRCGHFRKGGGEESVAAAAAAPSPKHSSSDGIGTVLLSETATLINKFTLMAATERRLKRDARRNQRKAPRAHEREEKKGKDAQPTVPEALSKQSSEYITEEHSPLHQPSPTTKGPAATSEGTATSVRKSKTKQFATGSQQPPPLIRSITDGRFQTKGSNSSVGVRPSGREHEQSSPVFIQFLDAVYQLLRMFPDQFEFTPYFLTYLAEQVYGCRFGTFLMNCHRDRVQEQKIHAKAYHKAQHNLHSLQQQRIVEQAQAKAERARTASAKGEGTDTFDLINSYSNFDSKGHLLSGSTNTQNASALPSLENVPSCCLRDGQYAAIATTTASVWGEVEELVLRERLYPHLTPDSDKIINVLYDSSKFQSQQLLSGDGGDESNLGASRTSLPTINGKPCAPHTSVPLIPSVQPRHYFFWNSFFARPHSHFTDFWHSIAMVDAGYGAMGYNSFQSVGSVAINPFGLGYGGSLGGEPSNIAALIAMFVQSSGLSQVYKTSGEQWLAAIKRHMEAEGAAGLVGYGGESNAFSSATDSGAMDKSATFGSLNYNSTLQLRKPLPHLVGFLFHMFRHRAHVLQMLLPTSAVAGVHPDSTLALAAKRVQQETARKAENAERLRKEASLAASLSTPSGPKTSSLAARTSNLQQQQSAVGGSTATTSNTTATNFAKSIFQAMRGGQPTSAQGTPATGGTSATTGAASPLASRRILVDSQGVRRRSKSSDPQMLGSPSGSPGNSSRLLRGTPTLVSPHTTGGQPNAAFPSFASNSSSRNNSSRNQVPLAASRKNHNGLDTPPANQAITTASIASEGSEPEQVKALPEGEAVEEYGDEGSEPRTPNVFRRRNAGLVASGPGTPNHSTNAQPGAGEGGNYQQAYTRRSYSAAAAADAIRNPHLFGDDMAAKNTKSISKDSGGAHGEAVVFGSMDPDRDPEEVEVAQGGSTAALDALLFNARKPTRPPIHVRSASADSTNSSTSTSGSESNAVSGQLGGTEVVDTEAAESATPRHHHNLGGKLIGGGRPGYSDDEEDGYRAGPGTRGGSGAAARTTSGQVTADLRPRSGSLPFGNRAQGGHNKNDFIPRSSANSCELCSTPFTFFNRRHCCRRCSRATCEKCSNHSVLLQPSEISLYEDRGAKGALRVCTTCYSQRQAGQQQQQRREGRQQRGSRSGNASAAETSTSDVPDNGDD